MFEVHMNERAEEKLLHAASESGGKVEDGDSLMSSREEIESPWVVTVCEPHGA